MKVVDSGTGRAIGTSRRPTETKRATMGVPQTQGTPSIRGDTEHAYSRTTGQQRGTRMRGDRGKRPINRSNEPTRRQMRRRNRSRRFGPARPTRQLGMGIMEDQMLTTTGISYTSSDLGRTSGRVVWWGPMLWRFPAITRNRGTLGVKILGCLMALNRR